MAAAVRQQFAGVPRAASNSGCLAARPFGPTAPSRDLPVVLTRLLQGDAQLEVEQRGSTAEGFGKGHRIPLSFGEALRRMAAGDASLYLTTQVGGMGEV